MKRGCEVPRHSRQLSLCVGLALAAGAAVAQAPAGGQAPADAPMAQPAPSPVFAIRGFQVEGENPLGEGETAEVLAPYLRSDATIETLQQATATLEAALRSRGYGLHKVVLPPQEVGDTVRLQIVKFSIGKIDIQRSPLVPPAPGAKKAQAAEEPIYDDANVRATVPELQEGASPNFRRLAVQTAIANESPNKQVQVSLRESEQPDRIDATINVREQRPWTLGMTLANSGSKSSGRDRFTISGGHTNLFNRDHQFIGAYTTSFERPSDVRQLGLSYKAPMYDWGGVVGVAYTRSDVVGNFGTFTSTGAGHTFAANYTHYLAPQGGRRSYVLFGIEDKVFNASRINDIVVPGALDRRSRPVTIGYTARTETDTAVWGYNADLVFNTGWGSDNDLAAYQSEDPRITKVRWKAIRGNLSYAAPIGSWYWSARAAYQWSPDVLISGEQFGLGGVASVRGTEVERPISGDKGLSVTFELNTPELAPGLRLLGFVDAGWLANNGPETLSKPGSDRLASAGLGLRYGTRRFAVAADYGYIMRGSRVPLAVNSNSPQKGDERFYLSLTVQF